MLYIYEYFFKSIIQKSPFQSFQTIESEWNESRTDSIKTLEQAVEAEKTAQWRAQGQELLIQAKKENVLLQLEAAYRERLMTAYSEVNRQPLLHKQVRWISFTIHSHKELHYFNFAWYISGARKCEPPPKLQYNHADTLTKCSEKTYVFQ